MCNTSESSSLPKSFVLQRQVKGLQAARRLSFSLSLSPSLCVNVTAGTVSISATTHPELKTVQFGAIIHIAWRDMNRGKALSISKYSWRLENAMANGRSAKWPKWSGQHHCIIVIPTARQTTRQPDDAMR